MMQFLQFLKTTNEKQRKIPSLPRKLDFSAFLSGILHQRWAHRGSLLFGLINRFHSQHVVKSRIQSQFTNDCDASIIHTATGGKEENEKVRHKEEHGHWRQLPGSGDSPLFQFFHGWCDVACGDHVDSF